MTLVESLTSHLAIEGFVRTTRPAVFKAAALLTGANGREDLWYFGSIPTARGPVGAYLFIPDLNFVDPPHVLVPERPSWLAGWRPHLREIDGAGIESLCFSDHEKFQLLAHSPSAAIFRMIEDAGETLNRIAQPDTVLEDSKREMTRLWQSDGAATVFLDAAPLDTPVQCKTLMAAGNGRSPRLLVGFDPSALAKKLGITTALTLSHDAVVYPQVAGEDIYLTSDGPPKDLGMFARWLKTVAPKTFALWHAQMLSASLYKTRAAYHFFKCGTQFIGYFVALPTTARRVRSAKDIREFLAAHVYGVPLPIKRLYAQRMDEEYLVRRNLESDTPDLRGLQVLLIGAGAIGGFLAQTLVQLGAGGSLVSSKSQQSPTNAEGRRRNTSEPSKKVGTLHICDRDIFTNANVGRHILGTQSIGELKADAVREHLQKQRFGVSINAIPRGFETVENDLAAYDLIIDATGYETFGRHISKLVRAANWLKPSRLLLHVWLEGRGGVVRCLSQDKPSCACYSCMMIYAPSIEPRHRFPAYSDAAWNIHGDDGYATMTPFAVSAPMAAAALATDAVLSWRAGTCSPRFRSRSSEGDGINPSVAKDLVATKGCPGCNG
ncbi:MAG: ThiF family adenylyltransferase [Pseudomonadota bacterium]